MLLSQDRGCPFSTPILFKESEPLYSAPALTAYSVQSKSQCSSHSVSILQCTNDNTSSLASLPNSLTRPTPSRILFQKSVFANEMSTPLKLRPIGSGLINEGCTCYCNATLQALMYLPPFIRVFEKKMHSKNCTLEECYFCILEELYRRMMMGKQSVIHPTSILLRLKRIGTEFSRHRQSDANEFLVKLLERIEYSLLSPYKYLNLDYASKCTTLLHQIMGNWMQSEVSCPYCKHVSTTFTMEFFCSLEISNGVESIEHALKRHTRREILGPGNEWKCDKCQTYVRASKRITFHEIPTVLCLQLKRFEYKFHGMPTKLGKSVTFSEHLDIQPYLSAAAQVRGKSCLYSLKSIIVHYGNVHGGHYIAYVKALNGIWHEMNDSRVRPISLKSILSATSDAYVLFYTLDPPFKQSLSAQLPSPPPSVTSSPILNSSTPIRFSSSLSIANISKSTLKSASPTLTSSKAPFLSSSNLQPFVKCRLNPVPSPLSSWSNPARHQPNSGNIREHYDKQNWNQRNTHGFKNLKRPTTWDRAYDQGKTKKVKQKFSNSWRNAFSFS